MAVQFLYLIMIVAFIFVYVAYDALFPSSVMKGKDTVHAAQEFIKVCIILHYSTIIIICSYVRNSSSF